MKSSNLYERIRFRGRPQAHPDAVVERGNARFTVLTPRLLRLEWSETGQFEDRCTYAFPTRHAEAPPAYTASYEGDALVLDTGDLLLRYRGPAEAAPGAGAFDAENLAIELSLNGERVTWSPGAPNPQNLRGTRRTLDGCDGDAALEPGLLSRAGWALFDDSQNVVFGEDGWVAPRPDWAVQDWYFFGYGHEYRTAIREYTRFGGESPLIPRYILGGWWSRYWAYSEQDFRELVAAFEAHNVPLDVFVIDMDWHTPDGWTGYTWNRELFPDPPAFLRWLHQKGLRVTLNLHPADGIHPHEEVYPSFARAMGIDPASEEPVPFRIADKTFVKHYFEIIHHPMEDEGVDFWWMDWQQGEISEVKGLDPLPWINHLHFNDIRRHTHPASGRALRPMLYSRWGGLGNHRYYIGFSGDTYVSWASLQFQPHLTATAANVAYGWWSHDIGGHMGGPTEPELYARWVQFGALSPILRLHATKDPRAERRPWAYPEPAGRAAGEAFRWRYRLVPYLYTVARHTAETGEAPCTPMYFDDPESDAAYTARYQYYLGSQMIAAPIVFPASPETGLAAIDVWVPAGTWTDYQTLETFTGPRWVRLVGDLDRVPMLMKSGAILPLAPEFVPPPEPALKSGTTGAQPRDSLELAVFPGTGTFRLYEDDGLTDAYREGQHEWTGIHTRQTTAKRWVVTVDAVQGRCDALPAERELEIHLKGCRRPQQVLVDGAPTHLWHHDAERLTTTVTVPRRIKSLPVTVAAVAEDGIIALGAGHNRNVAAADAARLLGEACPEDPTDLDAILALEAPGAPDAVARLGGPFASFVEHTIPYEAAQQMGHVIVAAPADGSPYDIEATFTLHRAGAKPESYAAHVAGTRESHILATPFAFEGPARTTRWEAEVALTWRGQTRTIAHASQPYFPTIHAVRAVIYNREETPLTLTDVVDEAGRTNAELAWEDFSQEPGAARNLAERHIVRFYRGDYSERLRAGEPLAAYLSTTVRCPEAREAVLLFGASEPFALTLNGEPVAIEPQAEDDDVPAHFRGPRRTVPLQLRAGENTLVVASEPPSASLWHWYFAGAFATPQGELMLDLEYE